MGIKQVLCVLTLGSFLAQPALAAVSCSVLTQGQNVSNTTGYATASITPSANALILLAVANVRNTADACTWADVETVSGNSLTWVKVNEQCYSSVTVPTNMVTIYRSMGASPSTGTVSFFYGSTSQLAAAWAVIECTGVDTSGTNGSGAVAQSAINANTSSASITATLGSFGSANNATLGAFGTTGNTSVTSGSGFTELAEQLVTDSYNHALHVEFKNSNDTTVDASYSSADAGVVAIEIVASAAVESDADEGILWFP